MTRLSPATSLLIAFAIALVGTLGSLYFQYLGFEPCVLCWWQRIFLYPLIVIIPIGIWKEDRHISWYVLMLSILGALVALYQTLLYYKVIPEALAPCNVGISCTTHIPTLLGLNLITASLLSFVAIVLLMGNNIRNTYEQN